MNRPLSCFAIGLVLLTVSPFSYAVTADNVVCSGCVGKKDLDNKAITKKKIKKNAVRSKQVKNHTIKKKDLHKSVTAGEKNVIHVARSGGDFKNPVTAMASITDSSADNRYLVRIGPGVFDVGASSLQMKPYVEVVGAGIDATLLRGTPEGDDEIGVVTGADHAGLSRLRVQHGGGSVNSAFAIAMFSGEFTLTDVVAEVSGTVTTQAYAIVSQLGDIRVTNVHTRVNSSAMGNGGFISFIGTGVIADLTTTVSGGGVSNIGLAVLGDYRIHGLVANVSGGTNNTGVVANGAHLSNIETIASGGDKATGIELMGGSLIGGRAEAAGTTTESIGIVVDGGAFVTASEAFATGAGTNWGVEIKTVADRVSNTLSDLVKDDVPGTMNCVEVYFFTLVNNPC